MAKTRPRHSSSSTSSSKKKKKSAILHSSGGTLSSNPLATSSSSSSSVSLGDLLAAAQSYLDAACPSDALPLLQQATAQHPSSAAAHALLGNTLVEVDPPNPEAAFQHYTTAASLASTNPQYLLWAAQLHPDGGAGAVPVYEAAMTLLRGVVSGSNNTASSSSSPSEQQLGVEEARTLLTSALCSCAEIYMSDLCMEPDAEQRCERYVGEAVLVSPDSCEALQTLASMRISQERVDEAAAALRRAREAVAKEIEAATAAAAAAANPTTPVTVTPFPVRVGLARLLVEVGELEPALETLEELLSENDTLVDLWYLGGWTWYLIGEKALSPESGVPKQEDREEVRMEAWKEAAKWLIACLKLYEALEWEDEGIKEHAVEVLGKVKEVVGEVKEDEDEDEDGEDGDEEWESEDGDEDDEMN